MMKTSQSWRIWAAIGLLLLLTAGLLSGSLAPNTLAADPVEAQARIEPLVLEQLAVQDEVEFFVWMTTQADLSAADALPSKQAKGEFVFNTLTATAETTQKELRDFLEQAGADYRPFYIANKILVHAGDENLVKTIAARPDVAKITANHQFQLQEPFKELDAPPPSLTIESNITFVNADDVWAMGYDGSGIVLAGNDTGLDWDHPAIINQYRGWNGSSANHNYNWWDATGTYPTVPNDGHGHGTHTTGTMVGDDGGTNQIGLAPGAHTIHCKNMTNSGSGNDATFTECFEWDLAPWNLNGNNPDPSMAPHSINNSWGYWGGNAPQFENEIANLRAAGIVVEVSAGNEGPGCATLRSPGDYAQSLTTGSVNHAGGSLPGTITGFSSRGPSDLYPNVRIPDVMAPGESIRSSLPGTGYASWSGTSMAGPHTAALVGLIWDAAPGLIGDVAATEQIVIDTAVPLAGQTGSNCGGNYASGPNDDWGHGTIDALAAVNAAVPPAANVEFGRLSSNQADSSTWNQVTFNSTFSSPPVVVMSPPSFNGGQPTSVRVRNITTTGFQFQIDEWDYLDGYHTTETLFYIAAEPGTHNWGGLAVEAGQINSQNHNWQTTNFSTLFSSIPVVFAQQVTSNGSQATTTRVRNVNGSNFEIRLQEEEGNDGTHTNETVHYLAIASGTGSVNGFNVQAGNTTNSVTEAWYTINVGGTFTSLGFLAEMQTFDGGDTTALRYQNLGSTSLQVKAEEEESQDTETNHTTEVVGWVVFGP